MWVGLFLQFIYRASISEIGPYGKFKQTRLNGMLLSAGVGPSTKNISFSFEIERGVWA